MDRSKTKVLTDAQVKLLASPLRIRILHALAQREQTAAQAADALGESRGNVHYHIQKLHDAGFLTVIRTELRAGVVERYYKTETLQFGRPVEGGPGEEQRPLYAATWISRTRREAQALFDAMITLLGTWEAMPSGEPGQAHTWRVEVHFTREDTDDVPPTEDGDKGF